MKKLVCFALGLALVRPAMASDLPPALDLRDVAGKNLVSTVKSQSGGTCWTFGTMAALEGNLLVSGQWLGAGESGEANLAEYHLDWWNGFNRHHNADIKPESGGLTVHQGGDYRVAAAYLSRGGAVRDSDAQSYNSPPEATKDTYHTFYARHIEWFSAGKDLERIDRIKQAIRDNGVIGTALAWSTSFYNSSKNSFYQPPSSSAGPNHAVAIVGWDDAKQTQAPEPGAWLAKNSWGSSWGKNGFFWISYYDKVTGQHPEMGAVSFRNVERLRYDNVYYWDYHGWRDTKAGVQEAFNAFTAGTGANETVKSLSFYTATENVEYRARVFSRFEDGRLLGELTYPQEGVFAASGMHTIDLDVPVKLVAGRKFYVYVRLSRGGHPFDKTSNVPVLLCGTGGRPLVKSAAEPGQSYYMTARGWKDLTEDDATANFTIKALVTNE